MENPQTQSNSAVSDTVAAFLARPDVLKLLVQEEQKRVSIKWQSVIMFLLITGCFILLNQFSLISPGGTAGAILLALLISIAYYIGISTSTDPRTTIVPLLAKTIDPNLTYSYRPIDQPEWVSNPKIVSTHDSINITNELAYTYAENGPTAKTIAMHGYEIEASIQSGKSRAIVTFGFITEIVFSDPKLVVTPDVSVREQTGNALVKDVQNASAPSKDRIILESNEFDREFHVYCEDQIVAREILTPDVMDLLGKFCDTFKGCRYDFLFTGNKLYITYDLSSPWEDHTDFMNISTTENYLKNTKPFEQFYLEFLHFKDLISDLNLVYYEK